MISKLLPSCVAAFLLSVSLLAPSASAGDSLITNSDFANGLTGWTLNKMEKAEGTATLETVEGGKQAVHITVPSAAAKRYHVQFVCKQVSLQAGKTYHLKFRARSKPAGEIVMLAATHHGEYEELWRQDHLALKEDWADYTCDFSVKSTEDAAQILFSGLAAQAGEFWFSDISLTEG